MKKYEKNVNLILIIYFLYAFVMAWGVIQILFFQSLDLDFSQISSILITLSLTVLILEIPTGIITDFYGRRKSILIFSFCIGLASFLITLNPNFYFLIFISMILGIGFAFASGTISALLFESLKKINRKNEFKKYLSKSHLFFVGAGVLTNFTIPIIFGINTNYPFYIGTFCAILMFITSLFLFEDVNIGKNEINKLGNTLFKKIKNQFNISFKIVKENNKILWIMIFSSLFGITISIFGDLVNQPLVKEFYSLELYGIIFAIATIIQTVLLIFINNIIKFISEHFNEFWFLVISWPLTLILVTLYTDNIYILIMIFGIMWTLASFRDIIITNDLNQKIENDSKRATILSSNSMLSSLIIIIFFPLFGYLLDLYRLEFVIYIMAGFSFFSGLFLLFFKK